MSTTMISARTILARTILTMTAAACLTTAAAAQDAPYPASMQRDVVRRWLADRTGLPPAAPTVFGAESVVVILSDTPDAAVRTMHKVVFHEEATQPGYAQRMGGRSIVGQMDIDCRAGAVRLSTLSIYSGANRQGPEVIKMGPRPDWRPPVADRVLSRVMIGVCGTSRTAPVVADAAKLPPRPLASPPPPSTALALKPSVSAARPVPARVAQAQPPALPPTPQPPPTVKPAVAVKPPAAQVDTGAMVQIAAAGSNAGASQEWDKAAKAAPAEFAGKSKQIAKATVNGAEVYRGLVAGFASKADAASFCDRLKAKGRACFLRR
ncbi:MAG: SPOR domain-containing protein [Caulobacteraceae bacterium]